MKVLSIQNTVREVVSTETVSVPDEVVLSVPADEFIALVCVWSMHFNGYDGVNGLRERMDRNMSTAWNRVFPETPRPDFGGSGDSVTESAKRVIKLVLGS